MSTLQELRLDLSHMFDKPANDKIKMVGGLAGKKAGNTAAKHDLGGDMAYSGMKRKVPLTAGFDVTASGVTMNLGPKGLWILANDGRRKAPIGGRYTTGRGRGKNRTMGTFNTPWGPRTSIAYRGPGRTAMSTLKEAEELIEADVRKAIDRAWAERIMRF